LKITVVTDKLKSFSHCENYLNVYKKSIKAIVVKMTHAIVVKMTQNNK